MKNVEKIFNDMVQKFSKNLITIFFGFLTILLLLYSISGSAYIDMNEITYFGKDSILLNILLIVVILSFLTLLKIKYNNFFILPSRKFLMIFTGIYIIGMIILILVLQISPVYDQGTVLYIANCMLDGNFYGWQEGEYCFMYPYQNGIILFFAFIQYLFGQNNWLIIQFLNIVALIVSAVFCSKIVYLLFNDKKLSRYSYLALLLFIPINFYVTFIYGSLFGLALAIIGIYFIMKYIKSDLSILNAIFGIFFSILACYIKQNYLIFFIGCLLLILYDTIVKKRIKSILLFVEVILVYSIFSLSINIAIKNITGIDISDVEGIPKNAWIAMGFQESWKAPGWYNFYNTDIFEDNNYNGRVIKKIANEEIKNRLETFLNDKKYALEFFNKKISSQWNNGTFECFGINMLRNKHIEWPGWVESLLIDGAPLNTFVINITNSFLMFLWLGIICFLLFDKDKIDIYSLIFGIIFIGGFMFHLVWEAKGQYTIVYVYILIPYMLRGYQMFLNKVEKLKISNFKFEIKKYKEFVMLLVIFFIVIIIGSTGVTVINYSINTENNGENYEFYKKINFKDDLEDGEYIIKPLINQSVNLAELTGIKTATDVFSVKKETIKLFYNENIKDLNMCLDITGATFNPGNKVSLYRENESKAQDWVFEKVGESTYKIKAYSSLVLTYEPKTNTVMVDKENNTDNQLWYVEKAYDKKE